MSDIRITWDTVQRRGDWTMLGPDLEQGHDLATAILVSLFTHRTASEDFRTQDQVEDKRGWWADIYEDPAHPIGSRLWQFYRAVKTDTTLNDVRDACSEALQWLVDDNVAEEVVVGAQWYGRTAIGIQIVVRQGPGPADRYAFVWNMEG